MYLDYFGLDRDPFTISPDPAFLYPSPQHRQALAHLKYGLDREGGFILLTGEVGTGKTTLTRLLLEQLPGNIRVAYILNAKLNTRDVLASICSELQLEFNSDDSIKSLTDVINRDLLEAHSNGKKTLLVVEESQNLDPDVLEMLRLLTNLETNTAKLLHILLVGQPELLDLIARNELRQLNQRVVSRFHIEPLSLSETSNYINHRMRKAGGSRQYFDATTVKTLHKLSGGIPRMLNLLAERTLLGAYATSAKSLSPALVKSANDEVFGQDRGQPQEKEKRSYSWVLIFAVCMLAGITAFYFSGHFLSLNKDETKPSATSLEIETFDQPQPSSQELNAQIDSREKMDISEQTSVETVEATVEVLSQIVEEKNVYEQLFSIWGFDLEIISQMQLCSSAEEQGLACQSDTGLSIVDLYEINRPGLVTLNEGIEAQYVYLVTALNGNSIEIVNSSGRQTIAVEEFAQRWAGDLLYLWKTPSGYEVLMYPGSRNPQMVDWVQRQLELHYDSYEYVIAGGIYSQAISDSVAEFQNQQGIRSDGLLGPRTIMRLTELSESFPSLMVEESAQSLEETN